MKNKKSNQFYTQQLKNIKNQHEKKMKKIITISIISSTILTLSGCASLVNGTHQNVQVVTQPVSGAACLLSNSKGSWHIESTPGYVSVHRAYGPLAVSCHKKGYLPANRSFHSSTKGMAFGNVVFGGVIGGGVDVADGAAYNYPDTLILSMRKTAKKQPTKTKLNKELTKELSAK